MQRRILFLAIGAALVVFGPAIFSGSARAVTDLSPPKGIWLTTDFPSMVVRSGETADIQLKLHNEGVPPEVLKLSVEGLPSGWKSDFTGNGQPIMAAMPATDETVDLDLHLDIPADAQSGTHDLTVVAKGDKQDLELPIAVALGNVLPAKLTLKPQLPSLKGSPSSSFDYSFSVKNDSGKNLVVSLAAQAPQNFQTSFTEGYGSQEINSIPIDAGQSKDLKVKVQPPANVAAGDYKVQVTAAAEGVNASMPLSMQVTGQPHLRLSGKDDRLSAEAEADKPSQINLVLSNDGSAPAQNIDLSASPPADWKVSFDTKTVDQLAPGETHTVVATLTPSAKALAGDYMTTFRADAGGESSSADFRISVTTSTLWGVFGIALIAVALVVLVGAVARYGRR
jgi:uncharacterized membrane protein